MNIIYHFRVKGVGPERVHISGIAGAFQNLGHKVTFVSPTGINPLKTGDVKPQTGLRRQVLYWLADKAPQVFFEAMEMLYNLLAIRKLKGKIGESRPDVIYERYAFFCLAGVYVSRRIGIPIVLEVNEVGGFDRVRPQKLVRLSQAFECYIFSNVDLIVTVSDFLKEQIVARGGKRERILVVPNGIDTRLFAVAPPADELRSRYGLKGTKTIGFVGYLVHWHRLDMLIEVFARIKEKHPDTVLLLAGDGVLRPELEQLSIRLGLQDSLVITGRLDHSEIPQHIGLFDIALIPNSNEYRSPIKMFEYMAMGKAIIAPDQAPIVAVLEDRSTGFIFKNGDQDDLFEKIDRALMSEEICRVLGNNAKKLVVNEFTWDIHAAKIISMLHDTALGSLASRSLHVATEPLP